MTTHATPPIPARLPPKSAPINARIILFALVLLGLIGVPAYWFVDSIVSGGISQRSDGYLDVDLKKISTFHFDQTDGTLEDIPAEFRALDGKPVVMTGEMWAKDSSSPMVRDFQLVFSIAKCCFSGTPQIQHFVQASVNSDQPVRFYTNQRVEVRGTLRVDVTRDDGVITGVYYLDVEEVRPA